MGLHDGHRQRLKSRFLSQGLEGFEDHNVLELLLFYSIPQKDTNEIAHLLLNEFGSLHGVFDAPVDALCKVKGVSSHTATMIKLMPALFARYQTDKTADAQVLKSTRDFGRYFLPRFYGKTNEEFHVMLLDDKMKIIRCEKAFEGTVNATQIIIKKLIAMVVNSNATGVVVAHNHPEGIALPSHADRHTTERIYKSLEMINVRLWDHIIVADGDYVSLFDSGEFERYKY